MSPDRDSQAVKFVEPDAIDGPGFSVSKDDSFPDKLSLRFFERAKDC